MTATNAGRESELLKRQTALEELMRERTPMAELKELGWLNRMFEAAHDDSKRAALNAVFGIRDPVTEAEHGRLFLSGLCFKTAEFLLRGALSEQWSMAKEMVINDLADQLRDAAIGAQDIRARYTNVPFEEWLSWVGTQHHEVAMDPTYRKVLEDVATAVTERFYMGVPEAKARVSAALQSTPPPTMAAT